MNWISRGCVFLLLLLILPIYSFAQNNAATPNCPVGLVQVWRSPVSVRIQNTSGKTIVGLVFHAALADATEHWKWLHWDFDQTRPLREFGWTKPIKSSVKKRLTWDSTGLDFEHGGGGALVLTSALFEDGTSWEDSANSSSCKIVWHNDHKKAFIREVALPPRDQ